MPASRLRSLERAEQCLLQGCIARGEVTLFSAYFKAGKTTWLAHLLRALGQGGPFCGLECQPARVVYVTEESENRWAARVRELGLGDHVSFLVRPFRTRPDYGDWLAFIGHVEAVQKRSPAGLIVFDTLSNLWPVQNENDAREVQAALMPLHALTENAGLLLAHHIRKADGGQGTAARGSGALAAFVDTILELRRYDAGNRHDRRRVLTGYGRWDDTPGELVIELREDGTGYAAGGDRTEAAHNDLRQVLLGLLPAEPPGWTEEEVRKAWPEGRPPGHPRLPAELRRGTDAGDWLRTGAGVKGSPFRYYRGPAPDSRFPFPPLGANGNRESPLSGLAAALAAQKGGRP